MERLDNHSCFTDNEATKILNFAEIRENIKKNSLPNKIIEDIESYFLRIDSDKSDDDLWEIIAQNCNPKWKEAKKELKEAVDQWCDIYEDPERIPLGLIGMALESEINSPIEERMNEAIQKFSAIDEALKSQEQLTSLLNSIKELNRTLNDSLNITKSIETANSNFFEQLNYPANDSFKTEGAKKPLSSIKDGSLLGAFKQLFRHKDRSEDKNIIPTSPTIKKPVL